MCGITGIYTFTTSAQVHLNQVNAAVATLSKRGPDHHAVLLHPPVALGHARLSIIDTSEAAHQPFTDPTGRYSLVFNGEIYNYRQLRKTLEQKGIVFHTTSDTEVLLNLLIHEGHDALHQLNGFFAFAFYDQQEASLFLARDRMGIKPLLYYNDEHQFVFGSEMKSLLAYNIPRNVDMTSLYAYLQLNYIPAPATALEGVKKLPPGHCLHIQQQQIRSWAYYNIPYSKEYTPLSYEAAQQQLVTLLEQSVADRMVSDVPLGSFLSGGTDSSIIATIAAQHTPHLNTFSIGYSDEPFFDETDYARAVAKKIGTEHTVFSLTNNDLFEHLDALLDYIDEPFADSSAIAVYLLSKLTRKQVTVTLSGDGADELFSGYNKHAAELKVRSKSLVNTTVKLGQPLWKSMPQSRHTKTGNLGRKLNRYAEGLNLTPEDRYWRWATFLSETAAQQLLANPIDHSRFEALKSPLISPLVNSSDFNDVLLADVKMVLPNDMLTKVDLMSMANSLEVRTPFLDHRIVEFAFSIPPSYKINAKMRKRIVQDAFRNQLPEQLYQRKKQGFEVPLLSWLRTALNDRINNDLLHPDFVMEQGLFNPTAVEQLKARLHSNNPGDAHATIWALIVFQTWWKKYIA